MTRNTKAAIALFALLASLAAAAFVVGTSPRVRVAYHARRMSSSDPDVQRRARLALLHMKRSELEAVEGVLPELLAAELVARRPAVRRFLVGHRRTVPDAALPAAAPLRTRSRRTDTPLVAIYQVGPKDLFGGEFPAMTLEEHEPPVTDPIGEDSTGLIQRLLADGPHDRWLLAVIFVPTPTGCELEPRVGLSFPVDAELEAEVAAVLRARS